MTDQTITNPTPTDSEPSPALLWAKARVAGMEIAAAQGDMLVYLLADAYLEGALVVAKQLRQPHD